MKKILVLILVYLSTSILPASVGEASIPHGQINTDQILKVFWQRVEEGKLVLFKTKVTRDLLKPIAVRVTQPLENTIPSVSVISEVGGKIYYPGMNNLMRVTDIEVVLGPSGEIIHIKPSANSARQ